MLNAWGDMLDAPIVPNNLDSIFLSKQFEGQLSIEEGSQLEVILEDGLSYQCKGMWMYKQHFFSYCNSLQNDFNQDVYFILLYDSNMVEKLQPN